MTRTRENPWPTWSPERGPGVAVRVTQRPAPVEVCLDVPLFVGVTRDGAYGEPVPVDSMAELRDHFGPPIPGGALAQSLHLFFANGGRRAVVINAAPDLWVDGVRAVGQTTHDAVIAAVAGASNWDGAHPTEPIATVCLPDLSLPLAPPLLHAPPEAPPPPSVRFADALPAVQASAGPPPSHALPLLAAPLTDADLEALRGLVEDCERADRVLLLDLPPGLPGLGNELRSSHLVLLAPRLVCVALNGPGIETARSPAAGAVLGLLARRERAAGVTATPAGQALRCVLGVEAGLERVPLEAVSLIGTDPHGTALRAAYTTSDDPALTSWMGVRLLQYLRRQVALDLRWAVFEPLDERLAARVEHVITRRLLRLHEAGALAAPTEGWRLAVAVDPDRASLVIDLAVALGRPVRWIAVRLTLVDGETRWEAQDE